MNRLEAEVALGLSIKKTKKNKRENIMRPGDSQTHGPRALIVLQVLCRSNQHGKNGRIQANSYLLLSKPKGVFSEG